MDKKRKLIKAYKNCVENDKPAYYYNGYVWSEIISEDHQYWIRYYLSECGLNSDRAFHIDYETAKNNGIEI